MDRVNKEQQLQFLQSLKDSGSLDLLLSELRDAPQTSLAAMHDGSKRRMLSSSSEEFDVVSAAELGVVPPTTPPKMGYQAPVVPKISMAASAVGADGKKKHPPMHVWERTFV